MPLALRDAITEKTNTKPQAETKQFDYKCWLTDLYKLSEPFGVDIDNGVGADFGFLL